MDTFITAILAILFSISGVNCNGPDQIIQISAEELNSLKESLHRLERFAENQISVNKRLEEELEDQRGHIDDLRAIISQQAEQIQRHQHQEQQQQEEQHQQPPQQKQPVKTTSKRASKNNEHANHIYKRHTERTVAFFATLSKTNLDHLGSHQNIVFEDVVTNIGNGYNSHQGTFVAPVSGLYLITTSVLSRQDREFWAAVVVNGTDIARLDGRGTDGRHGSGAQTVILSIKKGDDVSIQNLINDDDYWGNKYSSFGGFLIEEYEVQPGIIG